MEKVIQEWSKRDLTPLIDNKVDMVILKDVPASQLQILRFMEEYMEIAPQDPMDKIFLDIKLDAAKEHDLYGNTDLEWHIDKGYSASPVSFTGLYAVDIKGLVGRTLYVDNRIDCPLPQQMVTVDMDRFTSDDRYGYRFKNEAHRRWFRMKHRNVEHDLIKTDKRGDFIYFCEAYTEIEERELLMDLLYAPDRIYYHEWEKGDFVITNNVATNHKREASTEGVRHLWKIEGYNTITLPW